MAKSFDCNLAPLSSLTIVIPVHNGMPFIENTLRDLLRESHQGFRVIVSEDSSTDGTKQFLQTLKYNCLKIIETKSKISLSENWTLGIIDVRTKYVKLLCADDNFSLTFALEAINLMEIDENVIAVSGQSEVVNAVTGKKLRLRSGAWPFFGKMKCLNAYRLIMAIGRNILGAPSAVVFRTESLKEVMPWDDKYPYMIDVATYLEIFKKNPSKEIYFSRKVSSLFRLTPGSVTDVNRGSHSSQWNSVVREKSKNMGRYTRILSLQGSLFVRVYGILRERAFRRIDKDVAL